MEGVKISGYQGTKGFTMIEVIAVLVILGIVAAVVAVRMSDTSAYDLTSQAEVIKAHLRLAQSKAMGSGNTWGINFDTTTTYYLFQGTESDTPVQLLGEDADIVTIPGGVSVTVGIVSFDAWGKPCTDAAGTVALTSESPTLTVSKGGTTKPIDITPNTGYIH